MSIYIRFRKKLEHLIIWNGGVIASDFLVNDPTYMITENKAHEPIILLDQSSALFAYYTAYAMPVEATTTNCPPDAL